MRSLRALTVATIAFSLAAGLWACAPEPLPPKKPLPPRLVLEPRGFETVPGWATDRHGEALAAFVASCRRTAVTAPTPVAATPSATVPPTSDARWHAVCAEAELVSTGDAAARVFFEQRFRPWLITNAGNPDGLITGYYEPTLRGCLRPRHGCALPLYRPPPPAATLPSRAEIEAGALRGRGLELLWVSDPVDAFFLHIQGSGRVLLDDGRSVRVGYAGKNGHPYTAIGRELVRRGALADQEVSMQSIRAWLAANPAEAPAVMALNASYVFFQRNDRDGPIGTQGVVLTAGRSLAVDPAFLPLGVPVFVDTTDPRAPDTPLRRLTVAQDTGGAIKGVVRGDLFWGAGAEAEAAAGRMRERGRFYLLLPREMRP